MAKATLIYLLRRGTLRQSLAKEKNVFHAGIKLPKWNEPSNWVLAKNQGCTHYLHVKLA